MTTPPSTTKMSHQHYIERENLLRTLGKDATEITSVTLPAINNYDGQLIMFNGGICSGKSRLAKLGELTDNWKMHNPMQQGLKHGRVTFTDESNLLSLHSVNVFDEAQIITNIDTLLSQTRNSACKIILISQQQIATELLAAAGFKRYLSVTFQPEIHAPTIREIYI